MGPENRISFADARMPAVLATPWLIAHLESAARDALASCLENHERSVGAFVEVEHLAPTPEGDLPGPRDPRERSGRDVPDRGP